MSIYVEFPKSPADGLTLEDEEIHVIRKAVINRNINPRNYEYSWYIAWNKICQRLADGIDGQILFVAPQYPLWYIPPKRELSNQLNFEAHEIFEDEDEGMEADDEDAEDIDMAGNTSVSSVTSTVKGTDRKRLTDFALVMWKDSDVLVRATRAPPGDFLELLAIHLPDVLSTKLKEFIPMIAEIKRYPSREGIRGALALSAAVTNQLAQAKKQALMQVSISYISISQ